jgi:hypothetical protein
MRLTSRNRTAIRKLYSKSRRPKIEGQAKSGRDFQRIQIWLGSFVAVLRLATIDR